MKLLARLTGWLAMGAAWLLFAVGAMLTYEVTARYFFNAPTIWAEELSRLFMVWAVLIGSAGLMATNGHIRVTVLLDRAPRAVKKIAHVFALLFVAVVAGLTAYSGFPLAAQSFEVGRTTGSMLDIPTFWSQAAVPAGFALMALQSGLLAVSVALGGADPFEVETRAVVD